MDDKALSDEALGCQYQGYKSFVGDLIDNRGETIINVIYMETRHVHAPTKKHTPIFTKILLVSYGCVDETKNCS